MNKIFTLSEAQTLLPVLDALLQRARAAALHGAELELEMQRLGHQIFLSGGMRVDIVAAARRRAERDKAGKEARDTIAEIEAIGARVHDLESGMLDFPCQMEGRAALLCWKMGEETIGHWHGLEETPEQRRPIDGRLGRGAGERLN